MLQKTKMLNRLFEVYSITVYCNKGSVCGTMMCVKLSTIANNLLSSWGGKKNIRVELLWFSLVDNTISFLFCVALICRLKGNSNIYFLKPWPYVNNVIWMWNKGFQIGPVNSHITTASSFVVSSIIPNPVRMFLFLPLTVWDCCSLCLKTLQKQCWQRQSSCLK